MQDGGRFAVPATMSLHATSGMSAPQRVALSAQIIRLVHDESAQL